eukprot:10934-Ditylum_brightwellii.AAC.1
MGNGSTLPCASAPFPPMHGLRSKMIDLRIKNPYDVCARHLQVESGLIELEGTAETSLVEA